VHSSRPKRSVSSSASNGASRSSAKRSARSARRRKRSLPSAYEIRRAFGAHAAVKPPCVEPEKLDEVKAPEQAAKLVGLRYVAGDGPGFRRRKRGKAFRYLNTSGAELRDPEHLARIRSLVIPPAWTDVWICPVADGHLQATGRDARGRKQYRYHPRWREVRDATKYAQMITFARALPKIRRRVAKDVKRPDLTREQVLATVVKLLEISLIRVGNKEYARTNNSFGLTTLRNRHVDVRGGRITFKFRGKSGKQHTVDVEDKRLARIVRRCQELPGQELFAYVDDSGKPQDLRSDDVNAYLREISGADFTAKDFRTWSGTVLAALALEELDAGHSQAARKKNVVRAIEAVAKRLGNTPAVCRKCYVHPAVVDAYLEGATVDTGGNGFAAKGGRLRPEEAAVLAFLRQRLAQRTRAPALRSGRPARRAKAA
jgi:DNA topoisomerase-1